MNFGISPVRRVHLQLQPKSLTRRDTGHDIHSIYTVPRVSHHKVLTISEALNVERGSR